MRSVIVCAMVIVAACAEQRDSDQAILSSTERMDAYRAIQKCIKDGEDEQSCRRSCQLAARTFHENVGCIDGANDFVGDTFRSNYGSPQ